MATVKTAIILDTRRAKKDGTYPVKLRVTFERKQQYYTTPHDLTKNDFKRAMYGERQTKAEKTLKEKITDFEKKATGIIDKLHDFTWADFEKQYTKNRGAKNSINLAFAEYISQLKEADRIGTAVSYECAQKSLDNYFPGATFTDVTTGFLNGYEKWMLENGNSKTTIGIYLRSLRTVINIAITNNDILPALYPFRRNEHDRGKYQIPEGSNIKKALPIGDIEKIFNYEPEPGTSRDIAKDYWIFIYLTNGINVKDLCLLKYKDIKGDSIEFIRAKTARQKKEKTITAILQPETIAIIEKWGNKKKDGNTFIFPVLTGKETPVRQRKLIQQLTRTINDNMKDIADDLEINMPVTTYAGRHSFATVLKRSGASIALISEMLGHSNLKTTENYLGSFENDTLKDTTKALTTFKK